MKVAILFFALALATPAFSAPTYEQIDAVVTALNFSHWLVGDSGTAWQETYDNVGPVSTPAQEIDYYLRSHWGEEVAISKPGYGYDPDVQTVAQAIWAGDGIVFKSITGAYAPWTYGYVPDLAHWVSFDSIEPNHQRVTTPDPPPILLLASGFVCLGIIIKVKGRGNTWRKL